MTNGYKNVASGKYCEIWFSCKTLKEYKQAPQKDRVRVNKILDHLSENGPENLHDKQYKSEGRFSDGTGKKIMVYAVKSYQLRIYGWWHDGPPRRMMCPEGAIKKTDKADRSQLERVAKKAGE